MTAMMYRLPSVKLNTKNNCTLHIANCSLKKRGVVMQLVNIGCGNMISAERIIAIVSPDAAPVKRLVQNARDKGMLIDASCGRKTKAVIITDSDHVVLSAVQPETVAHRVSDDKNEE